MLTFRFEFNRFQHRFDKKRAWEFVSSVHSVKGVWRYLLLNGQTESSLTLFLYLTTNARLGGICGQRYIKTNLWTKI